MTLARLPDFVGTDGALSTTLPLTPAQAALVPPELETVGRRVVTVDGDPAILIRHERRDGRNAGLMGEHVSLILDPTGRLKGITRMEVTFALTEGGPPLPSRDRAREIGMAFLRAHAPDLVDRMRVHWVEAHDETIRVVEADGSGRLVTLTGMKMKCRNTEDGRWFWVIVGGGEQVMTFERDIVWITMPGHRQTEKWLHDAWLTDQGHGAWAG